MDRVFDEYLRYLKETVTEEDSARAPDAGRKPAAGSAGRASKRFKAATRPAKQKVEDEEESD
jgi:hypothetical protein